MDDDQSSCRALERFLRSEGFTVTTYDSGPALLESDDWSSPNTCLLLDVQMPVMNGLELHRCLCEKGCTNPTIFFTAYENENVREQALAAGARDFIYKGESHQRILAALARVNDSMSGMNTTLENGTE